MGIRQDFLQKTNFPKFYQGVALLVLVGIYSRLSVLTLTPVYGAAPSRLFHPYFEAIVGCAGWFLKGRVLQSKLGRVVIFVLPVWALWIPTLQYGLLQASSTLGPTFGPAITELFTFCPLLFLSVACGGKLMQSSLSLDQYGELATDHAPLIGSYVVYMMARKFAKDIIASFIGFTALFSRVGLQLLVGGLYSLVVPSKLLLVGGPSVLFTLLFNVHLPVGHMNGDINYALEAEGFRLVARQESTTGYISVLDNIEDGFRVMRCDHSLLGGQWTQPSDNYEPAVKDSIYSVFAMLEAVRLVEDDRGKARFDAKSKALVLGLGVGTTPAALISHGVETTIVEIDPIVHQFAMEYFHLPAKHKSVIADAADFVERSVGASEAQKYDYIVHDVFTGGVLPFNLFTVEFMRGLNTLLNEDGVIAINYAGDVSSYTAGLVVRTIRNVFPTCRVFCESLEDSNFTNMVVFCKKSTVTPLKFREPIQADYLRSKFRETHLVPRREIDLSRFDRVEEGGQKILVAKELEHVKRFQDQGAIAHWKIMRSVLPAPVWEHW